MKNIEEQKFAVGDIVKSTVPIGHKKIKKAIGQVVGFTTPDSENQTVGVQFEADIDGHNCFGYTKTYKGWWCNPDNLVLLKKHRGRPFGSKNKPKQINKTKQDEQSDRLDAHFKEAQIVALPKDNSAEILETLKDIKGLLQKISEQKQPTFVELLKDFLKK